ncbi:hypothetical protein QKU48_gp0857 [Fadolivirus algeromassiliense]|jgi:hypothetical protein|uniref:Uncharacterized protein n=1 Tax=Fadolivirus FV1/VV64 TaxID=3070911 RepID=A0A7D3V5N9_9VIRU|nr:hypothetical protein QKU48_gp0857 [Fadolivirus algeromassiliense]QKF94315.1 hypothetical protein Fadolivirus_1_857 [Fadolivirus FV1/VV64]
MDSNIIKILNNIIIIKNRIDQINKISMWIKPTPPPLPAKIIGKKYIRQPKSTPKPEKLDEIISQTAMGVSIPQINKDIMKDFVNKHKLIIDALEKNTGQVVPNDINNKPKIINSLNLAIKYSEYLEELDIPDINDELFLTKFIKTIYNNISKKPYPSGITRINHDGLNHLRSIATCAYFLSLIKQNNEHIYNFLTNNGNKTILKFIFIAAMFYSIARVDESGATQKEKFQISSDVLTNIFEFPVSKWINVVQYGLSSAILFHCIIKYMIQFHKLIVDPTQKDYIYNLAFYLAFSPPWGWNLYNIEDAKQSLISLGHYLDHCRLPQSSDQKVKHGEMRWSQLDTTRYISGLLKYVTNSATITYMDFRKRLYIFEFELLRDSGFIIKDIEFDNFKNGVNNYYSYQPGFNDYDRQKLPCYNIIDTKIDQKFVYISNNFDVAFDTIFNFMKFKEELSLIRPFLGNLEPMNQIIPLYDHVDVNNIQDYEDKYIIKQLYASTEYVNNIVRNNLNTDIFGNKYPKWFDWHNFIIEHFIVSYTREKYNYYNEILKYKQIYNNGLFSYLSSFGRFKLKVKNYLIISILTYLILNSRYSTDINVARGFKNNILDFSQDEKIANEQITKFMDYFINISDINIFEILIKNNESQIKKYMKNPLNYNKMKTELAELNKLLCDKFKGTLDDNSCSNVVLWHVADLNKKYASNTTVIEPTFISTSLSYEKAVNYLTSQKQQTKSNKCCLIKIKIPKNTPALWVRGYDENGESEHELLLPPNSKFKTLVTKQDNTEKMFFIESENEDDIKKQTIEEIVVEYQGTDVYISTSKFLDLFNDYLLLINNKITNEQLFEKYKHEMHKLFTDESYTLQNALDKSLCGLPIYATDDLLKNKFDAEISPLLSDKLTTISRKISNWKKRNMNPEQLLNDIYSAFTGNKQKLDSNIIRNDMIKLTNSIDHYNMMIQHIKPLNFVTKSQYDEFISDLIDYISKKIPKFRIRIKGTGTTFYSENPNPRKEYHYFDKDGIKTSDIDIMIEPHKDIIDNFKINNMDLDPSSNYFMNTKQYSRTSTFYILDLPKFYDKWGIFENPHMSHIISRLWRMKSISTIYNEKYNEYSKYQYLDGETGHKGILGRAINVNIIKSYDYQEESVHCKFDFVHEYP